MAAESSLPNDGGRGRGQNEFGGGSRQTHAASFYRASLASKHEGARNGAATILFVWQAGCEGACQSIVGGLNPCVRGVQIRDIRPQ